MIEAARGTPIAAVHDIVVVIDTLVSGVHFPPDTAARDIGYKSLAVNLSDIAAMGAEPLSAHVSLTRETRDPAWLAAFTAGLEELAARHDVRLAPALERAGPLCVSVEALGQVPRGLALTRAGARPGDDIYVTGTLGDAGLALAARASGEALAEPAGRFVAARLARPAPRIEAGLALRGLASAAIDVSDGLLADLGHILSSSRVGALIEAHSLPLSDALRRAVPHERALTLALTSGDDYELCFTVTPAPPSSDLEARLAALPCEVTRIGRVHSTAGLRVIDADGRELPVTGGYRHFS